MKLHKIYLFAALALATAFTSCSSDDDYEAGKPAGQYNIGFASEDAQVLSINDTKFDVVLTRKGTSGSVTVPITVVDAEGFTVPESATFNNGDSTAVISVGVPSDMEVCTDYSFDIRIPEEYTSPYSQNSYSPEYKVTVTKEDYAKMYDADFTDGFYYYGQTWSVEVEYSPSMDLYRIKDLYAAGYNLYFTWDKTTNAINVVGSDGKSIKYFYSGLSDSDYPSYFGYVSYGDYTYDATANTITFDWYWGVSAGWYGNGYAGVLTLK